ncbi:Zinc finger BED domain-containing protein 4, partial [Eumeta japonica]
KTKRDEEGGLQPQPKRQTTLSEIIDKKSLYVDDDVRAKDITLTIAEQICVDMEPFDLDISTRWDSTLQALRRLLEQRVAVQACLPRITCKAELTTEEWIMMEKVVNILRYFEEATKSISKSTATLSDAIPLINSLRKLLENMRGSSPRERRIYRKNLRQKRLVELIINLNEDLYSENASDMVAPTPSTSSEMTASGGLWSL